MDVAHMPKGTVILDNEEALTSGVSIINQLTHPHEPLPDDATQYGDVVYRVYRMRWYDFIVVVVDPDFQVRTGYCSSAQL